MNAKILFFLFLFTIPSGAAQADDGECPPYVEPEITSTPYFEDAPYSHSLSFKDIAAMQNQYSAVNRYEISSDPSLITSGLTTHFLHLSSENTVLLTPTISGQLCLQISKVALKINLTTQGLFIASEIPVNSCSYNDVLEHELRHVALARKFLDETTPLVAPQVRAYLFQGGVTRTSMEYKDEALASINQAFQDFLSTSGADLFSVLAKQQKEQIDTPEEYARLGKVCKGELSQIIRRSDP